MEQYVASAVNRMTLDGESGHGDGAKGVETPSGREEHVQGDAKEPEGWVEICRTYRTPELREAAAAEQFAAWRDACWDARSKTCRGDPREFCRSAWRQFAEEKPGEDRQPPVQVGPLADKANAKAKSRHVDPAHILGGVYAVWCEDLVRPPESKKRKRHGNGSSGLGSEPEAAEVLAAHEALWNGWKDTLNLLKFWIDVPDRLERKFNEQHVLEVEAMEDGLDTPVERDGEDQVNVDSALPLQKLEEMCPGLSIDEKDEYILGHLVLEDTDAQQVAEQLNTTCGNVNNMKYELLRRIREVLRPG